MWTRASSLHDDDLDTSFFTVGPSTSPSLTSDLRPPSSACSYRSLLGPSQSISSSSTASRALAGRLSFSRASDVKVQTFVSKTSCLSSTSTSTLASSSTAATTAKLGTGAARPTAAASPAALPAEPPRPPTRASTKSRRSAWEAEDEGSNNSSSNNNSNNHNCSSISGKSKRESDNSDGKTSNPDCGWATGRNEAPYPTSSEPLQDEPELEVSPDRPALSAEETVQAYLLRALAESSQGDATRANTRQCCTFSQEVPPNRPAMSAEASIRAYYVMKAHACNEAVYNDNVASLPLDMDRSSSAPEHDSSPCEREDEASASVPVTFIKINRNSLSDCNNENDEDEDDDQSNTDPASKKMSTSMSDTTTNALSGPCEYSHSSSDSPTSGAYDQAAEAGLGVEAVGGMGFQKSLGIGVGLGPAGGFCQEMAKGEDCLEEILSDIGLMSGGVVDSGVRVGSGNESLANVRTAGKAVATNNEHTACSSKNDSNTLLGSSTTTNINPFTLNYDINGTFDNDHDSVGNDDGDDDDTRSILSPSSPVNFWSQEPSFGSASSAPVLDEGNADLCSPRTPGCELRTASRPFGLSKFFRSSCAKGSPPTQAPNALRLAYAEHDAQWFEATLHSFREESVPCSKVALNGDLVSRSVHILGAGRRAGLQVMGGKCGPKAFLLSDISDVRPGLSSGELRCILNRLKQDQQTSLSERAVTFMSKKGRSLSLILPSSELRTDLACCIMYLMEQTGATD